MKTAHDLVTLAKQQIAEISLDIAEKAILEADLIIDVREPGEFQQGHLPGAINIPRGLLEFKLSASADFDPRDLDVLLYCKTSGRAALAAQAMQAMGYTRVRSIMGGYDAWVEAGKTVVKPTSPDFE